MDMTTLFMIILLIMSFYPSALRAGGVLLSLSGRVGGRAGGRAAAKLAEPISLYPLMDFLRSKFCGIV